jgi:hypothetical protein
MIINYDRTVFTILNYDHKTFIVQATVQLLESGFLKLVLGVLVISQMLISVIQTTHEITKPHYT